MFGNTPIQVLGATLTPQVIVVVGLLVIVTAGLTWFLNHTLFGKALRASAVNPTGAKLMGIDISRFRLSVSAWPEAWGPSPASSPPRLPSRDMKSDC